ncbi:hypothetical protein C8J57DRAFT_1334035 [Mycena rebaudengoi]|nr:hypothetical protein C8J57DRAFT_1334035 [Mycena rebaudengoi]
MKKTKTKKTNSHSPHRSSSRRCRRYYRCRCCSRRLRRAAWFARRGACRSPCWRARRSLRWRQSAQPRTRVRRADGRVRVCRIRCVRRRAGAGARQGGTAGGREGAQEGGARTAGGAAAVRARAAPAGGGARGAWRWWRRSRCSLWMRGI